MTLNEIIQRLSHIDADAQALLRDAGFESGCGIDRQKVPYPCDEDGIYQQGIIENLLDPFVDLHEELEYLKIPCHGEHTLRRLASGRYGYPDENGEMHPITCGTVIEAKVPGRNGRMRWARTRVEHDGNDYFLWGHGDIPLDGLTMRQRRWPA